jgi:hypothetical protein
MDCTAITRAKQTELAVLTDEINDFHAEVEQATNRALHMAYAAGVRLRRVKDSLGHGEFGPWLKANFNGSARIAQVYMRIAEPHNWSLIRESQRVAHLTIDDPKLKKCMGIRSAIKLLANPGKTSSAPPQPAATIIDADNGCKTPEKPEPIVSNIGSDNANNVTCPNCGREVQPDDDGDCPQCREPKIDQAEQAVGQSALPPAPEPRPCMFTDKMKDDLEELFGALDNARRWAMHESIFDTAEWKSNGQEIRTKIRAVWSAFSDLQRAAEDSGIFADEEADQ